MNTNEPNTYANCYCRAPYPRSEREKQARRRLYCAAARSKPISARMNSKAERSYRNAVNEAVTFLALLALASVGAVAIAAILSGNGR